MTLHTTTVIHRYTLCTRTRHTHYIYRGLVNWLSKVVIFSKFDIKSGFWHIQIHELEQIQNCFQYSIWRDLQRIQGFSSLYKLEAQSQSEGIRFFQPFRFLEKRTLQLLDTTSFIVKQFKYVFKLSAICIHYFNKPTIDQAFSQAFSFFFFYYCKLISSIIQLLIQYTHSYLHPIFKIIYIQHLHFHSVFTFSFITHVICIQTVAPPHSIQHSPWFWDFFFFFFFSFCFDHPKLKF